MSTTLEPTAWCDEYSALLKSDVITPDAIAGAPDEIETQLELLAEAPDVAAAELESFLDEMDDVLTDYAPPEMLTHLTTLLDSVRRTSIMSTAEERAAEVAEDELDQWAWLQGCEGASEPLRDE